LATQGNSPNRDVNPSENREDMAAKIFPFFPPGIFSAKNDELHPRSTLKQEIDLADVREEVQALRKRNRDLGHFQSVLTAVSPDAIIATDKNLNIIEWNPAAERLFGWMAAEVLGQSTSLEAHSHIVEALKKEEVFNGLASQGYWIGNLPAVNRDGQALLTLVSVGVLWSQIGAFNGLVAIYHEIPSTTVNEPLPVETDLDKKVKQRTEELEKANWVLQQELAIHKREALLARESEGKNRDLTDNIKLGIFRCIPGPKGKFIEVNKAMEEITGYSRDELMKIDVVKIWTDIEEGAYFTNEVSITDWKVPRELQLTRKDGKKVFVSNTIVAIRFDSGIIQYFDGILEDITERKRTQMQVQQSLQQLQKTIKEIIEAMAYIGEVRDPYTAGHQRRVAHLSSDIARSMGLRNEQYEGLTMAAFVHDIGKILVPSDILSKPGKLTKPEFDMLKDHTRVGYEILKTIDFPWPIAKIVLQHHERMDGSGYPAGLNGDQIIIEARILAVADVVEAMSSHRPYRPALGIDKALEEINLNRGSLYDSTVVDACTNLFADKTYGLN
jgi:PAS domain S-box-containing protein/putative nucleotidyltransferase with HDIG domain